MTLKSRLDRETFIRHLIVWILITAYLCILDPIPGGLSAQIPVTAIIMVNYMLVFYLVSLFILPRYWKVNPLLIAVGVIVIFLIFNTVDYITFYYFLPQLGGPNYYLDNTLISVIWQNLITFAFPLVPGISYFFSNLSIAKIKLQSEREKMLLLSELNFLKNQFNSHITFNFLNYCYSNVHQISEKTADAIELFSNMLRYSLVIQPDEKVVLEKEIEYINNFIELQRLLTAQVYVNFSYTGDLKNNVILSRVLITFVENAFKHGQINSVDYPITISLIEHQSKVNLRVLNQKNSKKSIFNTGIGHGNVMQILQLYYPDKHQLCISDDGDNYVCELHLDLTI